MNIELDNNNSHPLNDTNSKWLSEFVSIYQQLSTDNLHLLNVIYHQDVVFADPMHEVKGLIALHCYFEGLYQNLTSCDFVIEHVIEQGNSAAIYWQMTYQHPKLNKGKVVTVYGNSRLLEQDDKVIYHRDFLDLGSMLYEQIPLLGQLIKWVKNRAVK
ncbi:nuclear transport factor 2 family protein [Psychromonas sp. RZ22]|uniref:nuclear transport factor 2 family protein n=1 Tax=Psychromonas algarum TaxID=2555643 RepID=UPI001068B8F9|nr:nuclear transport factor 2 family protein [Psychromonas sp. RZ22]TEW55259.1 nuclear transport factor 2 family protein [Psychromonas sp. RZ22]